MQPLAYFLGTDLLHVVDQSTEILPFLAIQIKLNLTLLIPPLS